MTAPTRSDRGSAGPAKPKILIVHTLEWSNAARLALAFRSVGCEVYALCRARHPLRAVSGLRRIYTYKPFAGLRSLAKAIADAAPDLIVPCDDPAVRLMHQLHLNIGVGAAGKTANATGEIIERSLGRSESFQLIATRSMLPKLSDLAGVRVPSTGLVAGLNTVEEWLLREGAPVVLKADLSWGGRGVGIVRNLEEARRHLRRMTGLPYYLSVMKRLLWDKDPELLVQLLKGRIPVLTVQSFIRGKLANCSVVCWQGEVLASVAVEVLVTHGATGNATVVRIVDNAEMVETAARIVRQIQGTGFYGFDFILEEATGHACLLEINPRVTQISHLALGKGHDLPVAIRARLAGEPIPDSQPVTTRDTIAFFPQELARDPTSPFLISAFQDIPREEPALVRAFLAKPSFVRRLVRRVRTIQVHTPSRNLGFHAQ